MIRAMASMAAATSLSTRSAPQRSADPIKRDAAQVASTARRPSPLFGRGGRSGGGKSAGRSAASTWNRSTGSGKPRNRQAPRLLRPTPSASDSMTAARTAEDMTICRPCPAKQMRAAAWTERPTYPVSVSAGRPRCIPIRSRTSSPSGQAPACIARWIASAASSAAGACSNTAKTSSPRADASRPPAERTAARTTRRTSASRAAYRSPRRPSSSVEPSRSVSRNVM